MPTIWYSPTLGIRTSSPPELMEQLSRLFESPNRFGLPAFYTVDVWAWKDNPTGAFVNGLPTFRASHSQPKYAELSATQGASPPGEHESMPLRFYGRKEGVPECKPASYVF